jgi:acyl-CoA thioester hydrolase
MPEQQQEAPPKQDQPELARHRTSIRVRYAETDQMGVVYHANYYVWMEIGRIELVRSRGLNYKEIEQQEGLCLAVVESQCRYLASARYDQEILIDTWISSRHSRGLEFGYEMRVAGADRVIAKGATRHMWLDRDWRPTTLPQKYAARLA